MNTLIFLCGAGVGALVATLLMLAVMGHFSRSKNAAADAALKANERSADLLEERNRIGKDEAAALARIADAFEAKANS